MFCTRTNTGSVNLRRRRAWASSEHRWHTHGLILMYRSLNYSHKSHPSTPDHLPTRPRLLCNRHSSKGSTMFLRVPHPMSSFEFAKLCCSIIRARRPFNQPGRSIMTYLQCVFQGYTGREFQEHLIWSTLPRLAVFECTDLRLAHLHGPLDLSQIWQIWPDVSATHVRNTY